MILSDAIWMGDSLKKPDAYTYLSYSGSCGCALGGAILAVGGLKPFQREVYIEHNLKFDELTTVKQLWPWLTSDIIDSISFKYCLVAKGEMTIDQLCDYVRSIEPAEPEYEPKEEYWSDADTTREMVNSIKGR